MSPEGSLLKQLGLKMTNVAGFAHSPSSSAAGIRAATSTAGDGKLYYLMTDGTQGTVAVSGAGAQTFSSVYQTSKFVFLVPNFAVTQDALSCTIVIIRKEDGALFCPPGKLSFHDGWSYERPVQEDGSGNRLAFRAFDPAANSGTSRLYRLDFGSAAPTLTELWTEPGYPEKFAMNTAGDVIFQAAPNGGRILRIVTIAGGITPSGAGEYTGCYSRGPNGSGNLSDNFYYTDSGGSQDGYVRQAVKSGTGFTLSILYTDANRSLGLPRDCESTFATSTRVYAASWDWNQGSGGIFEIVNPSHIPRKITVPGAYRIRRIRGNDTFLLLWTEDANGNGSIVKFTIATEAFTTLIATGTYIFGGMEFSDALGISFTAQRLSDGSHVLGEMLPGATDVTILSSTLPLISQLIRLH